MVKAQIRVARLPAARHDNVDVDRHRRCKMRMQVNLVYDASDPTHDVPRIYEPYFFEVTHIMSLFLACSSTEMEI